MVTKGMACLLATDHGDGTYTVLVMPQLLGQWQLIVTVNSQHIQGSPVTLNIVPKCDYAGLNPSVQVINGIKGPRYIAFSGNGDMFVTTEYMCMMRAVTKKLPLALRGLVKCSF